MLVKYQNYYNTTIVGMREYLDIYIERKKEINSNTILKTLIDAKKWTYKS